MRAGCRPNEPRSFTSTFVFSRPSSGCWEPDGDQRARTLDFHVAFESPRLTSPCPSGGNLVFNKSLTFSSRFWVNDQVAVGPGQQPSVISTTDTRLPERHRRCQFQADVAAADNERSGTSGNSSPGQFITRSVGRSSAGFVGTSVARMQCSKRTRIVSGLSTGSSWRSGSRGIPPGLDHARCVSWPTEPAPRWRSPSRARLALMSIVGRGATPQSAMCSRLGDGQATEGWRECTHARGKRRPNAARDRSA